MSVTPSPLPSTAYPANVAGMNCIGPSAPEDDGPTLWPCPDSTWPMAASTCQSRPWQVVAAARYSAR